MHRGQPGRRFSIVASWDRIRKGTAVEWVALLAALLPIVVAVVRARAVGWMPLFDAGYFTARSRDVLTEHHPLVGAWSMGSRNVDVWVNNLGPLQLDVLAPFTKVVDPYWGTAVGVGLVNIGAVVGVWLVARRLLPTAGVVGAMLATIALEATMGSLNLIEARQQLALLLPFWCLLWLAAAMWTGASWAVPWTVFVASFVMQTHFTFVYQALAVSGAALVAYAVVQRPRWRTREIGRTAAISAAVAALCWAQPLWDQFFGRGNLGDVIANQGAGNGVGTSRGMRFVADSVLTPPFWAPGTMGTFLRGGVPISAAAAWFVVIVWVAALAGAHIVARRHGHSTVAALGGIALVAITSAAFAASRIPPTAQFGVVPYNYYWMWPIGLFMSVAVVAGLGVGAVRLAADRRISAPRVRFVPAGLAVATIALAIPVLWPVNHLPETKPEDAVARRTGRPLVERMSSALAEYDVEGPVLVDRSRETALNYFTYTILTELQRHDVDFRFAAGTTDLARFGRDRCDDGSARHRLFLADGDASLHPREDEVVLAAIDDMDPHDHAELTALNFQFGQLLYDGIVDVDQGAIAYFGYEVHPHLAWILEEPGRPANGVADWLARWQGLGAVEVPQSLHDDFVRWAVLDRQSNRERYAVFLAPSGHPPGTDLSEQCATRDPSWFDLERQATR